MLKHSYIQLYCNFRCKYIKSNAKSGNIPFGINISFVISGLNRSIYGVCHDRQT